MWTMAPVPTPSCSPALASTALMGMRLTYPGILNTPRVFLLIIFPLVSFILYLVLLLGCINDSISGIAPVIVRSAGPIPIGGQPIQVDIRIGFWGICIGPAPLLCTRTPSLPTNPRPSQLTASLTTQKEGDNPALAALALALQSALTPPLRGIPLLLLLAASVVANLVQIYVNTTRLGEGRAVRARAALWARGLDWAAAAGVGMGFAAWRTGVEGAGGLVEAVVAAVAGGGVAGGVGLEVGVGGRAEGVFVAVVVVAVVGAGVNTVLAGMDLAYGGGDGGLVGGRIGGGEVEGMERKRAAYERFP